MIAYSKHGIVRHNTTDGERTLCGLLVGDLEPLALPVNCVDCRTVAGERVGPILILGNQRYSSSARPKEWILRAHRDQLLKDEE